MSWRSSRGADKLFSILLRITLGVDFLITLGLALAEFSMAKTLFGALAAAALLAVCVANGWAFHSVQNETHTWARDTVIAQGLTLILAAYVIVIDLRSPVRGTAVLVSSGCVFLIALVWFAALAPRAEIKWTKTAIIVAALFPLAGFLQFWMQTYYIPSTSKPSVDISTELSPQSWSGSIIHLSAKVIIHNRGAASVIVANGIVRLTAYPPSVQELMPANSCMATPDDLNKDWCRMARVLDLSGRSPDTDLRETPTLPASRQLLYASNLGDPRYSLEAGETDTIQRSIDIDFRQFRLVRLSVSALFVTERTIEDIRSCQGSHTSFYSNIDQFSSEIRQVQPVSTVDRNSVGHVLCREYEIAPANILEKLIASRPALRVYTWLDNPPDTGAEYPLISAMYGTVNGFGTPDTEQRLERKLEETYPTDSNSSESEYAPTDKPRTERHQRSPAPADPPGSAPATG